MAQLNWTYTSDRGQRYTIGMYHGSESGHFLVYCNSKIILIDFHVQKSSAYSFFIENELLEIKIEEDGNGGFDYDFTLNEKVETPKNQERKKRSSKHFTWSMAGLVLFALLIFGIIKILDNRNDQYLSLNKSKLLKEEGLITTARVVVNPTGDDQMKMTYAFIANGKAREFHQDISLLQAGLLPVRSGDQFKLTFLPQHPKIHDIHFNQPRRKTLKRYKELVLNKLLALHSELDEQEASCILQSTIEAKGISGLADLFYQDLSKSEHPKHNKESFQKLLQSKTFRKKLKKNCSDLEW